MFSSAWYEQSSLHKLWHTETSFHWLPRIVPAVSLADAHYFTHKM
jgi:hypothetical protein